VAAAAVPNGEVLMDMLLAGLLMVEMAAMEKHHSLQEVR